MKFDECCCEITTFVVPRQLEVAIESADSRKGNGSHNIVDLSNLFINKEKEVKLSGQAKLDELYIFLTL